MFEITAVSTKRALAYIRILIYTQKKRDGGSGLWPSNLRFCWVELDAHRASLQARETRKLSYVVAFGGAHDVCLQTASLLGKPCPFAGRSEFRTLEGRSGDAFRRTPREQRCCGRGAPCCLGFAEPLADRHCSASGRGGMRRVGRREDRGGREGPSERFCNRRLETRETGTHEAKWSAV